MVAVLLSAALPGVISALVAIGLAAAVRRLVRDVVRILSSRYADSGDGPERATELPAGEVLRRAQAADDPCRRRASAPVPQRVRLSQV
jgi:hypothetical protein